MASGDHSPCRDLQAAVHTPGGQRSNCGGRGQIVGAEVKTGKVKLYRSL